jgi:hypothetical protein
MASAARAELDGLRVQYPACVTAPRFTTTDSPGRSECDAVLGVWVRPSASVPVTATPTVAWDLESFEEEMEAYPNDQSNLKLVLAVTKAHKLAAAAESKRQSCRRATAHAIRKQS